MIQWLAIGILGVLVLALALSQLAIFTHFGRMYVASTGGAGGPRPTPRLEGPRHPSKVRDRPSSDAPAPPSTNDPNVCVAHVQSLRTSDVAAE